MIKAIKKTHGIIVTGSPTQTDCVYRNVTVLYSEDIDKYRIKINTRWTENTEPMITEFEMTPSGISLLSNALLLILGDRERYRLPEGDEK